MRSREIYLFWRQDPHCQIVENRSANDEASFMHVKVGLVMGERFCIIGSASDEEKATCVCMAGMECPWAAELREMYKMKMYLTLYSHTPSGGCVAVHTRYIFINFVWNCSQSKDTHACVWRYIYRKTKININMLATIPCSWLAISYIYDTTIEDQLILIARKVV